MSGFGFEVKGVGFRISIFGIRVYGLGFEVTNVIGEVRIETASSLRVDCSWVGVSS